MVIICYSPNVSDALVYMTCDAEECLWKESETDSDKNFHCIYETGMSTELLYL